MKEIDGKAKNIRALLGGSKYAIDYYQREYKWQTKQISELLEDLADKFSQSYDPKHEQSAVASYGRYFLGSIIVSDKDSAKYIIDGQQRLTSLTLLLIYLHANLEDSDQKGILAPLIFSQQFGKKSFNLDVPERNACMEALYAGKPFDETDQPESVVTIMARYRDIEDGFPDELKGAALPYFADWFIENIRLVEITAYSDADAYTIFETMNDRGLSLKPTDMLKGYILANITDTSARNKASAVWKERTNALNAIGKDEDADAIKSWIRSQYADSIRERKRGASPKDFDLIGTEFHRWIRDQEERLKLSKSSDFANFIEKDFKFYASQYYRLRKAGDILADGLEYVHYNSQNNFTLQYPVILAPLLVDDSEADILRKIRVTSSYIDILIARRIWNQRAIDYSTMQYNMFLVMKEIRGKKPVEVAELLGKRLAAEKETFSSNDRFALHGMNRRQIHRLLARFTAYVEAKSGLTPHYVEYVDGKGKKAYEVEHIWADHAERHEDEFKHPADFQEYRNRIGGLLLLPKSFNASYGDLPYDKKREHYLKQNLLAQSLHENAYDHSPGFKRFIAESGLKFQAHKEFKKADLDARQELYGALAEQIWSPTRLLEEAKA